MKEVGGRISEGFIDSDGGNVLIGFDTFIDDIISVVKKRSSEDDFVPYSTISEFGSAVSSAAERSMNFELVTKVTKLGGNAANMARGLVELGVPVDFIGLTADDGLFEPLGAKLSSCLSLGSPAHTQALEFQDGKLMMNSVQELNSITWEHLLANVGGINPFLSLLKKIRAIGTVNWTMSRGMTKIWRKLSELLSNSSDPTPSFLFVDLADFQRRPIDEVKEAMAVLAELNNVIKVTLGLNLREAEQLLNIFEDKASNPNSVGMLANQLRKIVGVDEVVVHPRTSAVASSHNLENSLGADRRVDSEEGRLFRWAPGAKITPRIHTGGGDHFNAGFLSAKLLGASTQSCLLTATLVSSFYVSQGRSPTPADIVKLAQDWSSGKLEQFGY